MTVAFPAVIEGRPTSGLLRFVAKSEALTTQGHRLAVADVDLSRYERNNVVLWDHDTSRLPIGRGFVFVEDDSLLVDVEFDEEDPWAVKVRGKYERGFLHAVSVGYLVPNLRYDKDLQIAEGQAWELDEISACCVPRDPGALILRGHITGREGPI